MSEEVTVQKWVYHDVIARVDDGVVFTFRRFQAAQPTRHVTREARVIIKKDLRVEFDILGKVCGRGCGELVCLVLTIAALPVWVPIQLLSSFDEDKGMRRHVEDIAGATEVQEAAWGTGRHRLEIQNPGAYPRQLLLWSGEDRGPSFRVPTAALHGALRIQLWLIPLGSDERTTTRVLDLVWDKDGRTILQVRKPDWER